MRCVTGNLDLASPLDENNFYMVIETSGSNNDHDEEKLNMFLSHMMEEGIVVDGVVANALSQQV